VGEHAVKRQGHRSWFRRAGPLPCRLIFCGNSVSHHERRPTPRRVPTARRQVSCLYHRARQATFVFWQIGPFFLPKQILCDVVGHWQARSLLQILGTVNAYCARQAEQVSLLSRLSALSLLSLSLSRLSLSLFFQDQGVLCGCSDAILVSGWSEKCVPVWVRGRNGEVCPEIR